MGDGQKKNSLANEKQASDPYCSRPITRVRISRWPCFLYHFSISSTRHIAGGGKGQGKREGRRWGEEGASGRGARGLVVKISDTEERWFAPASCCAVGTRYSFASIVNEGLRRARFDLVFALSQRFRCVRFMECRWKQFFPVATLSAAGQSFPLGDVKGRVHIRAHYRVFFPLKGTALYRLHRAHR